MCALNIPQGMCWASVKNAHARSRMDDYRFAFHRRRLHLALMTVTHIPLQLSVTSLQCALLCSMFLRREVPQGDLMRGELIARADLRRARAQAAEAGQAH